MIEEAKATHQTKITRNLSNQERSVPFNFHFHEEQTIPLSKKPTAGDRRERKP